MMIQLKLFQTFQVCPSCKVFHPQKTYNCECCGYMENVKTKISLSEKIMQDFDKQFVNDVL